MSLSPDGVMSVSVVFKRLTVASLVAPRPPESHQCREQSIPRSITRIHEDF